MAGYDRHCHVFSLDRPSKFPYPGTRSEQAEEKLSVYTIPRWNLTECCRCQHSLRMLKKAASKAAVSEEARLTLRFVEPLSDARTPLADFFSILIGLVRHMDLYPTRFFNGQGAQERADDGGGDLPLSQDYPTDALSIPTESSDSRLQAWKRMALRTFGSGAVDSRSHQNHAGVVKDTIH